MSKPCEFGEDILREFAAVPEGEMLPSELKARLEQHLAECHGCAERYAFLLVLGESVARSGASDVVDIIRATADDH